MKRNYTGCAICDSTWGNIWTEVEGERMFFCCEVCVTQFRRLVERIKVEAGWMSIDSLDIAGDRRGRTCVAASGGEGFRCFVAFTPQGEIRTFGKLTA